MLSTYGEVVVSAGTTPTLLQCGDVFENVIYVVVHTGNIVVDSSKGEESLATWISNSRAALKVTMSTILTSLANQ